MSHRREQRPPAAGFGRLAYDSAERAASAHLGNVDLLGRAEPPPGSRQRPRRPPTTASLWRDVLGRRVASHTHIELQDVWLFEWFPRAPGQFHTSDAESAREDAMHFRTRIGDAEYLPGIDHARSLSRALAAGKPDPGIVFDPWGKARMLDGGVGCIRLAPIEVPTGEVFWFMTACSNPIAHEGFPLRVSNDLKLGVQEPLFKHGAVRCRVAGELRILPDPMTEVLYAYQEAPRLYLDVTALERIEDVDASSAQVSVAVSFEGVLDGEEGLYASYVTFRPGRRGTFRESIDWLEQAYVREAYQGEIVTDFDQEFTHFPDAKLRLRDLMRGRVDSDDLRSSLELLYAVGKFDRVMELLGESRAEGSRVARSEAFVCYARHDRSWVDRIRRRLRKLGVTHRVWDDSRIPAGAQWKVEIRDALERARVAILVVSRAFLGSDFINQIELPKLLEDARRDQAEVLPVIVGRCDYGGRFDLSDIQTVNPLREPLEELGRDKQNFYLRLLGDRVHEIMRPLLAPRS